LKDQAATIESLSQSLLNLKKDFDSGITIQTAIVSVRTHQDVSAIRTCCYCGVPTIRGMKCISLVRKQTLLELAPPEMDASSRPECLPSTRQAVLREIIDWATDPTREENILWYRGLAGSGKSTISTTIASTFRDLRRLGAFVFFDRRYPERSHPSKVIRALAYKLGLFDPRIGVAICTAIDDFPGINDSSLEVQFTKLILEPLSSITELTAEGPIVLVFDALDECGDPTDREALLELFATKFSRLPSTIRVLITSRQLKDIANYLEGHQNIILRNSEVSSDDSSQDILTYFKCQFAAIRQKARLPSEWPGYGVIQDLGKRSQGLFVWASTVVKFINSYDPPAHLATILNGESAAGPQAALDDLYQRALKQAGAWDDVNFVNHFRTILETILVLQNPLATSTLDRLIGSLGSRSSSDAVAVLACVIASEPTVHLLHPSFADFLLSRERCGQDMWHFKAADCHRHLMLRCLNRLSNDGLKRNICNLTLSADLNGEKVPDDIAYSCLFWIDHLCSIGDDCLPLSGDLAAFLNKHLLHWFEVMSILGKSKDTVRLLGKLRRCVIVSFICQSETTD
jgi:hypothetical protein